MWQSIVGGLVAIVAVLGTMLAAWTHERDKRKRLEMTEAKRQQRETIMSTLERIDRAADAQLKQAETEIKAETEKKVAATRAQWRGEMGAEVTDDELEKLLRLRDQRMKELDDDEGDRS